MGEMYLTNVSFQFSSGSAADCATDTLLYLFYTVVWSGGKGRSCGNLLE